MNRMFRVWLLTAVAVVFTTVDVYADDFRWTGDANNSDWQRSANWNNHSFLGLDGVPGPDDSATFGRNALVQGGDILHNLTVEPHVVTIDGTRNSSRQLRVTGQVLNQGEITFFVPDDFNSDRSRLQINDQVTLSGGGTIRLNNAGAGVFGNFNRDFSRLINLDNTIRGFGRISQLELDNRGAIIAEGGDLVLGDNSGAVTLINPGTLEASVDSAIVFDTTVIDQQTVSINGPGVGRLIDNAFARQSTFSGTSVVEILGATLEDVTNQTTLRVGDSGISDNFAWVRGTLTNESLVTFQVNTTGDFNRFRLSEDTVLDGGGEVRLVGNSSVIDSQNANQSLTNIDNTIRGTGIIRDLPTFNNRGAIRAEGGVLFLSNVSVDNADGRIEIAADGAIEGVGSRTRRFTSGILDGELGGQINNLSLVDLETTGILTFGSPLSSTSSSTFTGTIANTGLITFEEDDLSNSGRGADQRVVVNLDVTLAGGGTIQLAGSQTGISNAGFAASLLNLDNTIRGQGRVSVDLENSGRLLADSAEGLFDINGDLTLNDDGVLSVLLDGDQFADSGLFDISTALTANGIFQPVIGDSFTAQIGDTYTFLTASSVQDSQFFDSIDHSLAGQYRFDLVYNTDSVDVRLISIGAMLGDANGDGLVNNLDIAGFALALFNRPMYLAMYPNTDPDAVLDMNNDGAFNNLDIFGFATALGF